MFGSVMLEVAIGVIFIFLLVSVICSAIREGIEAWFKTRAAFLEHGLRELLKDKDGKGLAKSLYEHPLIYGLFSGEYKPKTLKGKPGMMASGRNLPSYIPAKNFATVIMDIAARGPRTDDVSSHPASPIISLDSIRMNILNLNNQYVQRALLTAIDAAQGDLNKAQKNIEEWYDSAMDRVSGWYTRSTSWMLFWLGLIVAVSLNINAITIVDYLSKHDAERKMIVEKAGQATKDSTFLNKNYSDAKSELEGLQLPIGWSKGWGAFKHDTEPWYKNWWNNVWSPLLGWLIIAFAATMGAPFWFDLLNKVMVIRSTVKPHEKSPEESSEDRQQENGKGPVLLVQAQPAAQPNPKPAQANAFNDIPAARDDTSDLDGCGIEGIALTKDEDLPPSEGGIA
ncbi:MAG: hypothetical protein JWQ09_2157 [Segetibacter sp.]|nr:hypothetical protein [Segetibacter sp.]